MSGSVFVRCDLATGDNYRVTHSPSLRIEPFAWGPRNQIVSDCNDRAICLVDAWDRAGPLHHEKRFLAACRIHVRGRRRLVAGRPQRGVLVPKNTEQDRRFCLSPAAR